MPLTETETGEIAALGEMSGNGWPGSILACVGAVRSYFYDSLPGSGKSLAGKIENHFEVSRRIHCLRRIQRNGE